MTGQEKGNGRVNIRALARELKVSAMTLYRVLNNAPTVRQATRERVVEALNRHGFYALRQNRKIRITFDFSDNCFQHHYGALLMQRLSARDYSCSVTDHRQHYEGFLDAAAESDILVFFSQPTPEILTEARRINPELFTICLYTRCGADITITADNTLGGEMAAEYLHRMGHSHVAVLLALSHPSRMERYQSFYARMKLLNPLCRIDPMEEQSRQGISGTILNYLRQTDTLPTCLFFPAGGFAQLFFEEVSEQHPEIFEQYSIMSFDRPCDFWPQPKEIREFDRIEFKADDLLDWTEYYIINRPMLKNRTPIHTSIGTTLKVVGSVRKLNSDETAEMTDNQ